MEIGKVSEQVLRRSVIKPIRHRREDVLYPVSLADDCAQVQVGTKVLTLSINPVICQGPLAGCGELAVYRAANDVLACGAIPTGVLISVLLPKEIMEPTLRLLMEEIEQTVCLHGMELVGGHTQVCEHIEVPIIHAVAFGSIDRGYELHVRGFQAGQELVMAGYAGMAGTARIALSKEKELLGRFRADFISGAKECARACQEAFGMAEVVRHELEKYRKENSGKEIQEEAVFLGGLHNLSDCGIFGALYSVAESAKCGFQVDLRKIPLRQETVELCECFDLNPYLLMSEGALLIGTRHGQRLAEALKQAGYAAEVIGYTTDGKDKLVRNGGEVRCLDRPGTDELYRFFA